jgi:hypothetical protein
MYSGCGHSICIAGLDTACSVFTRQLYRDEYTRRVCEHVVAMFRGVGSSGSHGQSVTSMLHDRVNLSEHADWMVCVCVYVCVCVCARAPC